MAVDFDFGDDFASHARDIRAAAHIVNGGDATFPCPACKGTGKWHGGYRNNVVRQCFKCAGKGNVSQGVAAHAKGVITEASNAAAYAVTHAKIIADMRANAWNSFIVKMLEIVDAGSKLTDGQMAACVKIVSQAQARDVSQAQAKIDNSGEIELSVIDKLFATAKSNGLKKPVWRMAGYSVHADRQYGCNDLWIKGENEAGYVGKIVEGKFTAFRRAQADTLPKLRAVAANPLQAAIDYGMATNKCSCCGRGLRAGVSVVSGIGPICASNWGLDAWRDAAQDAIARGEA